MNESQKYVFGKMCETVGVKFKDIDFSKNDWYLEKVQYWIGNLDRRYLERMDLYLLYHSIL